MRHLRIEWTRWLAASVLLPGGCSRRATDQVFKLAELGTNFRGRIHFSPKRHAPVRLKAEKMRLLASTITDKRVVFFGEADSYTIIDQKIDYLDILGHLRIASLLYDHVILSAAHFWQSIEMQLVMPQVSLLIANGDILPSIRAPRATRDIADYFEKRLEDTAPLVGSEVYRIATLASEIALPSHKVTAERLERIGTTVHLDTVSIEAHFRNLWLADTADERDPYSIYNRLNEVIEAEACTQISQLMRSFGEMTFFSRSEIARRLLRLNFPETLSKALLYRASHLYLHANALASDSELLETRWSGSHDGRRVAGVPYGPLRPSNVDVFAGVLQICGIAKRDLDSLSEEELLRIKYSEQFLAFRESYFRTVEAALKEKAAFVDSIWKRFSSLYRAEKLRRRLIAYLRNLEKGSGALFTAALGASIQQTNYRGDVLMIGAGAGAAVAHVLRKIDRFNATPIADFADYLTKREYRKRLEESRRYLPI